MLGGPDLHKAKRPTANIAVDPSPRNSGKMKPVATGQVPKANQTPTEDPHYSSAVKRVKTAVRELQEKGIIDPQGRRVRKELPPDMQEDADRDFGG